MTEKEEPRINIKFCLRLGKTSTETYLAEMLRTAFGEEVVSRARVLEWFRRFKDGHDSVDSD